MNDLLEQYNANNQFGKNLGMRFEVKHPGLVHYHLKISSDHLATPKAAHGGVISALMDAMLGVCALSASSLEKKVVSTVEFKTNFLAPAFLGDELLGISKIIQKGSRIYVVSGEVFCPSRNNTLIATGMGTFNAYPAEKQVTGYNSAPFFFYIKIEPGYEESVKF